MNPPRAASLRLDLALVERGLIATREKARRCILAGLVSVGGQVVDKPGRRISADAPIDIRTPERYVGRGGGKLEAALERFGIDCAGRICLDIGASTGGFTDCLLQHGAIRVHTVDVGRGQLAWRLRQDPRVDAREGVNARYLAPSDIPHPVDLLTIDVSFISLTLILPAAVGLVRRGGDMVALVKPQFELGRAEVPRGGVVRDPALRAKALDKIRRFVQGLEDVTWRDSFDCPVSGADGNVEFLAWLQR